MAITITTTLTAIGNYYLDQKDIQEHLDSIMAMSTMSYQALLGDDVHQRPLKKIQHALNNIPEQLKSYYKRNYISDKTTRSYLDKFNFQVWTNGGKLILHSSQAPKVPLTPEIDGFSDQVVDQQKWRVFTSYNEKAGIRTVVGERYDTRNELGHRIAQDDLYIMLLTFPLSGLLIWIIIGKGLDSLETVTREVSNRAPSHLTPVNLEAVPEEIKPLIDELNKLFNRLQQGFEREKRFAADAAHELRTPLAALRAQAQVALNIEDMEEKNRTLNKLLASVDRSTHIVKQLLTMSRLVPESSTINDLSPVNLTKLSREVIAMLAATALNKHVEIMFETNSEQAVITGNLTALSIMMRNLIDNAIRYTPDHGEVKVIIENTPTKIIFTVEDNGPGIPKELHDRVFERFFRILGNKSPGSGLGLAIVHQIVDLHNGKLKLDTPKAHSGLIISVTIPK